jgi:argininosuccinate synthase
MRRCACQAIAISKRAPARGLPGTGLGLYSAPSFAPQARHFERGRILHLELDHDRGRAMSEGSGVKRVVLAYSGGLDTSVILRWLKDTYDCEVVTFTADIGQGEEVEPARAKAEMMGVRHIFVEDLRETFVRDYVFPMFRANALYEGVYLLGTSIARPLIARRQIEIAAEVGADAVSHGATGKGNDQVRFELTYYALKPDIRVIAPWREWDLTSRGRLIEYARKHQIQVPADKHGEPPYSMDANLLHISYEGKALEDPWLAPDEEMFQRTVAPEAAPDRPATITVDFERGDAVAVDGERMTPAALLERLNIVAGQHAVGRVDLVENRFVGMKSRGVYETPGGTVLQAAHRAIESLTLDREAAHLKDSLMPRYAELIYNGFWFSPERDALQALIDRTQERVTGTVRLRLYKGNVIVEGRKSPFSLYDQDIATFEEESVYDQRDAEGFIKLNALRLRVAGRAGS